MIERLDRTWFTDENIFTVTGMLNSQNDHFYAPAEDLNKDADPERMYHDCKSFPEQTDGFSCSTTVG